MSVLTYLTQTQITETNVEIQGKVLSRPALLTTDGTNVVYVVDVDIGLQPPAGFDSLGNPITTLGSGLDAILRNVQIARNNRDLIFAEAGNAVTLRRTKNGFYQVVGFSSEMPGTYTRFTVNLTDFTYGPVEDLSLVSRPLTYIELSIYGTYGIIPFGAVGLFKGGVLQEITA
jgi:hypothetical protein